MGGGRGCGHGWARRRAHHVRPPGLPPGNTIWLAGRLNGIVDWTNASWGPPASDLAHWRANLGTRHGIEVADLAADACRAAGGQAVDQPWWDVRILLDFVGDLDTGPAGVLEATEASPAALLARR